MEKKGIRQCDYQKVHLGKGLLESQQQYGLRFYLNIPNDSLLKSYRRQAGLDAPGEEMGGWYDLPISPAGHLIGHVISGLARFYSNSKDSEVLEKLNELVHEFGKTIREDGYFYNYPWKEGSAVDCYVYDKIAIGLLDAYRYADNQEALPILGRITDWMLAHISMDKLDWEWYTLPENLYECYAATGDEKYKKLAEMTTYHSYYDALGQKVNVLPGKHAYSHVNTLCSAAQIYLATQDEKYFQILKNAYEMILADQLYASGGYGPGEAFVVPGSDDLKETLYSSGSYNKFNTNKHNEAPCNSYALTKLSRYLFCLTGDAVYADVMERVIWNAFLGTLRPVGGGIVHYYDTYRPGGLKTYFTEQNHQTWPCCSGTYLQMLADYVKDIYFTADQKIYVNLYIASSIQWQPGQREVKIIQTSDLPEGERAELCIKTDAPERFTLCLRMPPWAESGIRVEVNGEQIQVEKTKRYVEIDRIWEDQDTVRLFLPKQFALEPVNVGHPEICALMYGSLLMVGETDSDALPYDGEAFIRSLQPVPGWKNYFTTTGLAPNVIFRPYYTIQDTVTPYTTYFHLNSEMPSPVLMDDIHPWWVYDNGWKKEYTRVFEQEYYLNDFVHMADEWGAEARIRFTGTQVRLMASRSPSHGKMKVKIDCQPEEIVDLANDTEIRRTCVWEKKDLPEGAHTLVVTSLITEEEKKKGTVAEIDALKVLPIAIRRT